MKTQPVYETNVYPQKADPLKVLKYHNTRKVEVLFLRTGTVLTVTAQQILKGTIEDKMAPKIWGVGYHGHGKYKCSLKSKLTRAYTLWYDMLNRCYNSKLHTTKHATYKNVIVCKEWHNYQNFAAWLENNYVEGWTLDKDLMGGKIYSPETCIYIPTTVNMAEAHLRKAKKENLLFEQTYNEFVIKAIKAYKKQ